MSSFMFVFLSGRDKGKTRIYQQDRVSIGTSDSCDLVLALNGSRSTGKLFDPPEVLAHVRRVRGASQFVVKAGDDFPVAINGERVLSSLTGESRSIYDGDTIRFGEQGKGIELLFHVLREDVRGLTPVPTNPDVSIAPDVPGAVHPLTAKLFVKELAVSLWAEIPSRAKAYTLGGGFVLLAGVFLLVYLNFAQLNAAQNQIKELQNQIEQERRERSEGRATIEEQKQRLDELQRVYEGNRTFAQRVSEQYASGVCLIVGSYTFLDKATGKPLRYDTADDANGPVLGETGELLASVDGLGSPVEVEFSGTGFLISTDLVLTNRHVIQPWWREDTAQLIIARGMRPKVERLLAYFPQVKTPFQLRIGSVSQQYDLALMRVTLDEIALPVLPLLEDRASPVLPGKAVVLLGYPAGVDALVERLPDADRSEVLRRGNATTLDVAQTLAEHGAIRPLTTQGVVGDFIPGKIVHNAATAEGGSGGPLFDESGKVIGINSAILVSAETGLSFPGSSFAIPIASAMQYIRGTQALVAE
jgi:S1-C subfamily serine protease